VQDELDSQIRSFSSSARDRLSLGDGRCLLSELGQQARPLPGCRRSAGLARPRPAFASRKTACAHTLAALAPASSRDAGGRHTSGALMRRGWPGRHGSHGRNSPRRNRSARFPAPCALCGRSACLAPRSSTGQDRHCVTGSPPQWPTFRPSLLAHLPDGSLGTALARAAAVLPRLTTADEHADGRAPRDPSQSAENALAAGSDLVSGPCRSVSDRSAMRPARTVSSKNAPEALPAAAAPIRHWPGLSLTARSPVRVSSAPRRVS
jgi:hypothetical protein